MTTRLMTQADLSGIQTVLQQTDLFPTEMLPDLAASFLSGESENDLRLVHEAAGTIAGFFYCKAEDLTDGTWNMRAIAVLPAEQGKGLGADIVKHLETHLVAKGQRVLVVDTSGTEAFADTRAFYRKNGYTEEARIRDFWAKGDDKVIFWKALS